MAIGLNRKGRLGWLGMLLAASGLALADPAWAGQTPAGQRSGVFIGPCATVFCAAPIAASNVYVPLATGITTNPVTGELMLTPTAISSLTGEAFELLQTLQGQNPDLAATLATPGSINSNQGIALNSFTVGGSSAVPLGTVGQTADSFAAAITSGSSVSVTTATNTVLAIAAPSPNPAVPGEVTTTATITPAIGSPTTISLSGTPEQVANAAAFLAAATTSGIAPEQLPIFANLALQGVAYTEVVALFNALSGLLAEVSTEEEFASCIEDLEEIEDPEEAESCIDVFRLSRAIQALNMLLDNSSLDTLLALSTDSEFLSLVASLRELRTAVDI